MADILIKGMEMPKNGFITITVTSDGRVVGNSKKENGKFEYLDNEDIAKAVPVPPHGRLGDLDKLENGLRHMAKYQHGERQQGILGCCETIRLAKTIIPAEEGE